VCGSSFRPTTSIGGASSTGCGRATTATEHSGRRPPRFALIVCGLAVACLLAAAAAAGEWHRIVLGQSVDGRPIVAFVGGDPAAPRRVLVVGCIHGNEPAGTAIASVLTSLRVPAGVELWVIPDLNPDGVAAGTRGNAHGVDLNRNFPWHWQHLAGLHYSGTKPLSEPESKIASRLILRVRPVIAIWFHQHRDLVDESGGSVAVERRFASLVHLRLMRLPQYPGSAVSWQNAQLPGTTAFVVELPAGPVSAHSARVYAAAVLKVSQ
jgi:murein peptide amidase A